MDDDDLRRGQPTNHKKFGEATAVLAGDALLTYAFNIIANNEFLPDDKKIRIISEISRAAGHMGMIGGQMIDMLYENKKIDIIRLVKMHTLKTGNMIIISARAGCITGDASEEETVKAAEYAKNIGLAFQVMDDILDITGDAEVLGKNVQSDLKNQKNTFVEIFNKDITETYEYAQKLTNEAILNLEELKKINKNVDTKNLEILAKYLLERKN
jgi:geranylgeranyl diphosphate synthase type II